MNRRIILVYVMVSLAVVGVALLSNGLARAAVPPLDARYAESSLVPGALC